MQGHGDNVIGICIGAVVGVYKSIAALIVGSLTWPVVFDSVILSAACALAGLIVTHFGKKLLKKLKL
jgi:hypothetical protein